MLFGGNTPFLLRLVNGSEHYMLVRECYAHRLLNGEAIKMLDQGALEESTFIIK